MEHEQTRRAKGITANLVLEFFPYEGFLKTTPEKAKEPRRYHQASGRRLRKGGIVSHPSTSGVTGSGTYVVSCLSSATGDLARAITRENRTGAWYTTRAKSSNVWQEKGTGS